MDRDRRINLLVVDDEQSMREFLELFLTQQGYHVTTASDGEEGASKLEQASFDVVITDVKMPKRTGMELLDHIRLNAPDTMVVMMTAFGTVETAVEAMRRGAQDYLIKPFKVDELAIVVRKALETRDMRRENEALRSSPAQ